MGSKRPMMDHLQTLALLAVLLVGASSQDIRAPPNIIYPVATTNIYNSSNSNVTVKCKAGGIPQPTYKWMVNGTLVVQTNIITYNSVTGDLSILGLTTREEATYICIATNFFDNGMGGRVEAASWSARVRIYQSRIDPFGGSVRQVSAPQFTYLKMECDGQKAVVGDAITYNWYKADRAAITIGDRLFIDQTGSLHFTYMLNSDSLIDGYYCGISSVIESYIRLGTQYKLTVTASSTTGAIPPQFQYSNTNVKGILYSSVKLECLFSGYDPASTSPPAMQWFDDASKLITPSDKYDFASYGRVLIISNLTEDDEKQYTCTATNSGGSRSSQVFLNVTSGPIWVPMAPTDQIVPENTNVQFSCATRSASGESPPSAPVWRINGAIMTSQIDSNRFYLSADGTVLNIRNVRKNTDIMCIQCQVSNDIDTVLANMCLNVVLPISVKTPNLIQEIKHGDRVNLTITATTDPSMILNYTWVIHNTTYTGSNHPTYMFYDPNTMVAYIDTSGLSGSQFDSVYGVYRRTIYNRAETKIVDIDIVRTGAQGAKAGLDPWIIGLIIALILLIIIIILIIFIICRKKQEGDYNVDKKETGAGLDPEKELKDKDFNAYSAPTYDEYYNYPDVKPPGDPEMDDTIIGDDESLGEYGKEDITHFNEDGSFIGIYQSKKPPPLQPAESSI